MVSDVTWVHEYVVETADNLANGALKTKKKKYLLKALKAMPFEAYSKFMENCLKYLKCSTVNV